MAQVTEQGKRSVRFTFDEAMSACDAWGFNCGPGAICAVLNLTPEELRPSMGEFPSKGYTNPTLMLDVLSRLRAKCRLTYRGDRPAVMPAVKFGVVRIQWAGPWTEPGVPMAARYRETHWIAMAEQQVFDINAICVGGWLPYEEWAGKLVPWLMLDNPKAYQNDWWPTHVIEVEPHRPFSRAPNSQGAHEYHD